MKSHLHTLKAFWTVLVEDRTLALTVPLVLKVRSTPLTVEVPRPFPEFKTNLKVTRYDLRVSSWSTCCELMVLRWRKLEIVGPSRRQVGHRGTSLWGDQYWSHGTGYFPTRMACWKRTWHLPWVPFHTHSLPLSHTLLPCWHLLCHVDKRSSPESNQAHRSLKTLRLQNYGLNKYPVYVISILRHLVRVAGSRLRQ